VPWFFNYPLACNLHNLIEITFGYGIFLIFQYFNFSYINKKAFGDEQTFLFGQLKIVFAGRVLMCGCVCVGVVSACCVGVGVCVCASTVSNNNNH